VDPELTQLWNVGKLLWTRQYVEMFALLQSIGAQLASTGGRLWSLAKQSVASSAAHAHDAAHRLFSLSLRLSAGPSLSALNQSTIARFTSTSVPPPLATPASRSGRSRCSRLPQRPTVCGQQSCYAKPTPVSRRRCEKTEQKSRKVQSQALLVCVTSSCLCD
jgi:hypothetical protein